MTRVDRYVEDAIVFSIVESTVSMACGRSSSTTCDCADFSSYSSSEHCVAFAHHVGGRQRQKRMLASVTHLLSGYAFWFARVLWRFPCLEINMSPVCDY